MGNERSMKEEYWSDVEWRRRRRSGRPRMRWRCKVREYVEEMSVFT